MLASCTEGKCMRTHQTEQAQHLGQKQRQRLVIQTTLFQISVGSVLVMHEHCVSGASVPHA